MAEDEPQPIDQAIDHVVVVLLQQRPDLDRQETTEKIRAVVDDLLGESS